MEIRNAKYKKLNGKVIDVEIEHPIYGWIPYTFISDEDDESFDTEIRKWLETATVSAYEPHVISNEEHNANINAQIQAIKIELQIPNMMLAVGTDSEKLEAAQTLRDYYTQIKALEAQLL